VPQEIERRLVLLHLGRRDQGGEDDPGAATVDDVMVLVPQPRAFVSVWHRRGVGIGRADAEIGRPPIGTGARRTVRATDSTDPVLAVSSALDERGARLLGQGDRQPRRCVGGIGRVWTVARPPAAGLISVGGEEAREVGFDGETGLERVHGGIGLNPGGIEVELLAPDQSGGDALLHDAIKEATEDIEAVPFADAAQAGVIGQRLVQVVAEGVSAG
jgi:hypothetical protein